MGQLHVMKVVPNSESEVYFMNLLDDVGLTTILSYADLGLSLELRTMNTC